MLGALIGAAASLLGANRARRGEAKAIAAQNEYNKPANVRARAEEAGFNPLLFVGPGVGQQTATGGSNFMGQAIADAGLMLADKITERQAAVKLSKAMDDNRRLQQQLTQATIRPKVGGIYAGSEMLPTQTAALGGSRASSTGPAGGPVSGHGSGVSTADAGGGYSGGDLPFVALSDNLPADRRRPVENKPVTTESGVAYIDNPSLPFRIPILTVNDEMIGPELPMLSAGIAYGAGGWVHGLQQKASVRRKGGYAFTSNGQTFAMMPATKPRFPRQPGFDAYGRTAMEPMWPGR